MTDDALARLIGGLRDLDVDVTVDELCEAYWLWRQSDRWRDLPPIPELATAGVGGGTRPPDARSSGGPPSPPRSRDDTPRRPLPGYRHPDGHVPPSGAVPRLARVPVPDSEVEIIDPRDEETAPLAETVEVRLPDAPPLSRARELGAAMRPLRYGPRRTSSATGLDEEATALRIAQAGVRVPAFVTSRRRRFDLDLVLDVGGSGPLWTRLADEFADVLRFTGAFRDVRMWVLESDAEGVPLRPGRALTRLEDMPAVRASALGRAPQGAMVMVLTDGAGRAWQRRAAYPALREWSARSALLLVQLLPEDMWDRTALSALPVTFRPARGGYHHARSVGVSDAELSLAGLDRGLLRSATAVPVIELAPAGLRSWVPLLGGGEAGAVAGFALVLPSASEAGGPVSDSEAQLVDNQENLLGEQRVNRFMLTASRDARELARWLSVFSSVTVPAVQKVRHELLPRSEPQILAEVMLGGLLHWTSAPPADSLTGRTVLSFHNGVQDLLMDRPGGITQFNGDRGIVKAALLADPGHGPSYAAALSQSRPGTAGRPSEPVLPAGNRPPALLPPYPGLTGRRLRPSRTYEPGGAEPLPVYPDAVERGRERASKPLNVGIWGSTQSGRTVYLAVLCYMGLGHMGEEKQWTRWRRDEWRLVPEPGPTTEYVTRVAHGLFADKVFPSSNFADQPVALSFRLEQRRRQGNGVLRWLRPRMKAAIRVYLEDRRGAQYRQDAPSPKAIAYLKRADVLMYFFDPTYDLSAAPEGERKFDSYSYFLRVAEELRLAAVGKRGSRGVHGALEQHIAVCVPKLDEQWIFDAARRHGCMELDPDTRLPWVPSAQARRLFAAITYDLGTIDADYLRREISRSFYPKRISYHALSSVGYYMPDGWLNLRETCNRAEPPPTRPVPADDEGAESSRLRGDIVTPIHMLDPLISLVERAPRLGGRQ
jgi:hypothetical protein